MTTITGALIDYAFPDHPPWVPHRTVTNADAIAALRRHMARDAISTGSPFFAERVSGNFFLASAGFCIDNPTKAESTELLGMWKAHQKTQHFLLWRELMGVDAAMRAAADAAFESCLGTDMTPHQRAEKVAAARAPFMQSIRPLEQQLESIYRSNRG